MILTSPIAHMPGAATCVVFDQNVAMSPAASSTKLLAFVRGDYRRNVVTSTP